MLRRLLQLSITLLTFAAFTSAASACTLLGYQPELPEELK
ncbi:cyclic lactone autoinducer peptide [Thermotalea metallivorans]|uniref:Cyclic lactone autoinducer peptide n=1 Tax=Thermotalea metallivorans TaxID=520762 RepID=A0A140L2R0_9FIRM|nr:cyclic lactone autoinducer peptide [Thermotalea metallivorans]KXG74835.1 hypothetical protein AN619_21760 [Thermotalea metallivorans]